VLLKCYANPTAPPSRNALSNIKLRFKSLGRVNASASTSLVCLEFQQNVAPVTVSGAATHGGLVQLTVNSTAGMATGQTWFVNSVGGNPGGINGFNWLVTVIDATHVDLQGSIFSGAYTSGGYLRVPASIRDIDIQFDVDQDSNQQPAALLTRKFNFDGSVDTTTDNYAIENVTVSGKLKNYNYGINAIDLFGNNGANTTAQGTWVGETIRNILLRNLVVEGSSSGVLINNTNISGKISLENIESPAVAWTITAPAANLRRSNLNVSGLKDQFAAPVTLTGTSATVGSYDIDVIVNASGGFTLTLPAAASWTGRQIRIKSIAAQTIASASANIVPLAGGAAATTLLANTAGKWCILESDGTNWVIMAAN
jgi:hypothetical protein